MVILGGLEFIIGGVLVHKHYKNKNEKRRLEEESEQRRQHTFPGASKPASQYQQASHPHHRQHHQHQHQHRKPCGIPQQKYAYYAQPQPQQPQPQAQAMRQPYYQPQFQHEPPLRHNPVPHTQSFEIPRRPVPQQQPPQIIQPLSRADSCATISRMPIANGYRPNPTPAFPPRRQQQHMQNLAPIPQSPYSNHGFSASTPALANSPITPTTPVYGTGVNGGRQTIDDNWETYAGGHAYAPSESTALGERIDDDEPPPPYRP